MEKELIKKLNKAELPEIEMQGHKSRLRISLLNSDYFKKLGFFDRIRKSLFFAVPATALLIILAITVVQPQLIEAKVLQIAKNNPEIKKIMKEQSMTLGDVKVKDGKAYVLLNPKIDETDSTIRIQKTDIETLKETEAAIIEVNINKKEVVKIDSINSEEFMSLDDSEKDAARNIAGAEEIVSDIIPKEAKVEKVSFFPQGVHMVERDDGMGIVPDSGNEKKASVQYSLDGKKWVVKVNLDKQRIEEIKYSFDDDKNENRNNKE